MTTERRMLCPVVVGRTTERDRLADALDHAIEGHGRVVLLVGEAGVGKTRLARDLTERARAKGCTVLAGRCVPGDSPVPYRPLSEAFASHFRATAPPDDPSLAGFGGHLGKLVPQWRGDASGGADESPVLLGEAIVRLAGLTGSTATVLVLEDLHWADAETLAVLEYFADTLSAEPLLCVATCRAEGRAVASLARLRRSEGTSILGLDALSPEDVRTVVSACLDSDQVPAEVTSWVEQNSDGIPFLIEELLAGLVATGSLVHGPDGWSTAGPFEATVPYDVGESIRQRLALLDPTARHVVRAAAMLGRRFAWDLLPGVAEVDGRTAVDALRAAVDAQIIDVDGDEFLFRHALTREAVLGELLPPERRDLASRAWPAVERANPGLPGAVCELAADLAEAAGRPAEAADRLVESARRGVAAGAYATAEATAQRARRLAPAGDVGALAADEVLVHILASGGKPAAALALGRPLVERVRAADPAAAVDLQLVLARAARDAGDVAEAHRLTESVRADLGDDPVLGARLEAIAAYVALDEGRPTDAADLAQLAVEGATATAQPEVACEALEVLGRSARLTDRGSSIEWFQRAADLAASHGLAGWELRARHELALEQWGNGNTQPLRDTRELAARSGALITQAVMDLSLADIAFAGFEREECLIHATACIEASRRYGLATEPVAHLWRAGAHALAGDDAAMEAALADALARDSDDPRILGDLHGRVLVTRAFVADDLASLPTHLDTMMQYVHEAPAGTSVFPGIPLWATLHATHDDDLGVMALETCRSWSAPLNMPTTSIATLAVEAVARARQGEHRAATDLVEQVRLTRDAIVLGAGIRHTQQILVASAAIREGWGDPAAWLRESEAFFAARGYERIARRCRAMIGQAGSPVPRRRSSGTAVPPALRALGVTSREVDVLTLVTEGCSNREIADRLFVSPKTVERHLANLFDRTGVRNRGGLADLARSHGIGDDAG